MKKELLCIVCPNSCRLQIETMTDSSLVITGNKCKRGIAFAKTEMTNPTRTLCTTVRTAFAGIPVLPVRTDGEIPKAKIFKAMQQLADVLVTEPLCVGDTVVQNLVGTGCRVIATGNITKDIRTNENANK